MLVLKVLGQDAGCDIHGSAGAERDNDGNGPIGIRGGSGARQAGQQQGADEEGAKQGLKLLHGLFLGSFGLFAGGSHQGFRIIE